MCALAGASRALEQRRLSDSRFTPEHENAAQTLARRVEQPVDLGTLVCAADERHAQPLTRLDFRSAVWWHPGPKLDRIERLGLVGRVNVCSRDDG